MIYHSNYYNDTPAQIHEQGYLTQEEINFFNNQNYEHGIKQIIISDQFRTDADMAGA